MDDRVKTNRGILLFAVILGVGMLVAVGRIAYLQLGNHNGPKHKFSKKILATRGDILDRRGVRMACSIPVWEVYLDPGDVYSNQTVKAVSERLASFLPEISAKEIEEKFANRAKGYRHTTLCITDNSELHYQVLHYKTNNLSGVGMQDTTVRKYPAGRTMSHILGYTYADGSGGAGMEQRFNSYLSATDGIIEGARRPGNREIYEKRRRDSKPIDGHNVYLTLDRTIQDIAERAIGEQAEKFHALGAWAIVQEVKTGAILAAASWPDYEPENYLAFSARERRSNIFGTVYEPGSIMKAVTVGAFLNERLGTPHTTFPTYGGRWSYGGKILKDHVTGSIDIATALKKSSNIVSAQLALRLGDDRFYRYLRAFNFGSRFGIEMPGESRGILPQPHTKGWSKLTPTRVAIGQGVAVTALQMVSAYNAIANDGVMMKPYMVDRIVPNGGGDPIRTFSPQVIGRPIRAQVARQLREMLQGVTDVGGTGRKANIKGYTIAGKTGTSQKVINGRYSEKDYYASFIGMCPASNPVFIVLVTFDNPTPQHTGSYVAAPIFAQIAAATAKYLEVPPDLPAEDEIDETDELPPPSFLTEEDEDLLNEHELDDEVPEEDNTPENLPPPPVSE